MTDKSTNEQIEEKNMTSLAEAIIATVTAPSLIALTQDCRWPSGDCFSFRDSDSGSAEITEDAQVRTLTSVSDTADGLWAEECRGRVGTERNTGQWSMVSGVACTCWPTWYAYPRFEWIMCQRPLALARCLCGKVSLSDEWQVTWPALTDWPLTDQFH